MRVLVCGGAGFIGTNLCEALIRKGHSITVVDNLYSGRLENIEYLMSLTYTGSYPFEFNKMDISKIRFKEWLNKQEFDQIYNLACPASPPFYQADPIGTFKTSVLGNLTLAEYATNHKIPLLYTSTSEVYGDALEHPQNENYWGNVNPIGIRSCYDEGKRASEALLMDYHRVKGLNCKIVRIFNTYGTHMRYDDGRVVTNFVYSAIKGVPFTIYGNGYQTRSFCYVDDLVRGLIAFMNLKTDEPGPINLGNPGEFTMNELADIVNEVCGTDCKSSYHALPKDDPKQRKPDISKAKSVLNWEPKISLREGIEKLYNYMKEHV